VKSRPVLVIEDDADSRLMLKTWLSLMDMPVVTAKNGAEGLKRAREANPCLILLDIMMPVMGGREFRLIQCVDPDLRDVPVVLTSAHPDAKDIAAELGLEAVIEKPIALEQIAHLIEKYRNPAPDTPGDVAPPDGPPVRDRRSGA
jgi:CheY-like chemotaxis protein